jgi:crossover junction endodeoxyribonuclease RuvC
MRVLGLDPGSRRTGIGVVEKQGNTLHCLHHGFASAGAKDPLPVRLYAIAVKVGEIMDAHAPDCVVVEEAFYHESVRSTLVLGHVRGALLLAAMERGLQVAEYTPREIKMSVTGSGGATKHQVAFMVRRILNLRSAVQTDAADALAVALCHHHRVRRPAPARAAGAAARRLAALLERPAGRPRTADWLLARRAQPARKRA